MKIGRQIRFTAEWIMFRIVGSLIQVLPRRAALAIGATLGIFAFDVLRIRRRVAVENVTRHLAPLGGKREAICIARRSYAVMGRTFIDIIKAPQIRDEDFWKLIPRDTVENAARVIEKRGAVLVSAHFGNWELLIHSLVRIFPRVSVMVGDQSNRRVDRAVKEIRRRGGIGAISARSGLREAVRFLRQGGALGTLMDQDARRSGIFVDFLGTPASTHTGIIALAIRAGVPFIPALLLDHGRSYELILASPWEVSPDLSEEENLRSGAIHYNRFLEERVRRNPENYFWAHRRWKTSPKASAETPSQLATAQTAPPAHAATLSSHATPETPPARAADTEMTNG
jgi:KDO2-lipid IV(A) lauroyltransferase